MCYWNKKKQGWTEAIALKDTKLYWLQKELNAKSEVEPKVLYSIEQKFMRWIKLK